jgi:hypothetical protein
MLRRKGILLDVSGLLCTRVGDSLSTYIGLVLVCAGSEVGGLAEWVFLGVTVALLTAGLATGFVTKRFCLSILEIEACFFCVGESFSLGGVGFATMGFCFGSLVLLTVFCFSDCIGATIDGVLLSAVEKDVVGCCFGLKKMKKIKTRTLTSIKLITSQLILELCLVGISKIAISGVEVS